MISTDEINAKISFLYFQERENQKGDLPTFESKVQQVLSQLKCLKSIIEQSRIISSSQDAGIILDPSSSKSNQLSLINEIDSLYESISSTPSISASPVDPALKPILNSILKPNDSDSSQSVSYELLYNKSSKNILIAAKISELRKRVEIINKSLSSWPQNGRYETVGKLIRDTEDKLAFMNSKSLLLIQKSVRALFDSLLNVQESKEEQDFRFDTNTVSELMRW